ncbi:MAG: glycoside hydrolase family 3 C-terminal domain-containing protein [Oscillospiraceae bacterium]|nr:glycoside hydrolase family 3 C-terminal domain-containing protein [Oscillospiraceae bacterium]
MDIKKIVSEMTLEEKASLCSGQTAWETKIVERLGVPSIFVADGPHGLRKQKAHSDHLGLHESVPATCFPTACATASSFDEDLIAEMGKAIAAECIAEDVSILLGPGTNIKRSPLCGRNFEYFSEDPYLSGKMSVAHINGVQKTGVGTSLKHYVANEQETLRMTISSEVDERTLREIYLAPFEEAVKEAKPTTIMCSYNKVNGVFASENEYLLTDILRNEWGFDGFVVSDWGAVNDRVDGLAAGLELEMPTSRGVNDAIIVEAVKSGKLDETVLDKAVERILNITFKTVVTAEQKEKYPLDLNKNDEIARRIAGQCIVLLKNEDSILPISKDKKVAFIGEFFERPRFQGGGSSNINPFKVTPAKELIGIFDNASYTKGFLIDDDDTDSKLLSDAVKHASENDVCVIFAGLPDRYESEGYDRTHMNLPANQIELIVEVAKTQPNTVVVLHNGSPIEMPWICNVKSVVEAYLGGQAAGAAVMDVLSGAVNPSGKLAETFPLRLQDNPSHLNFPGERDKVEYREGVFVGYRYYDKKEMPVLFPFGHGLSYTNFTYSDISVDKSDALDTDTINVSVKVKNTGKVAGKEIVQLYISSKMETVVRPIKELKGFKKISLSPGEEKTVLFTLGKRSFAFYDADRKEWRLDGGTYGILVGASSQDIRLCQDISVNPTVPIVRPITLNSTVMELMQDPKGAALIEKYKGSAPLENDGADNLSPKEEMFVAVLKEMPIRSLGMFSGMYITQEMLDKELG